MKLLKMHQRLLTSELPQNILELYIKYFIMREYTGTSCGNTQEVEAGELLQD